MEEINLRNYAYLGDAVWELFIRQKTVKHTNNAKKLHNITTELVKTDFQAKLLAFIMPKLTEHELDIVKRARNLPIPVGRRHIQTQYRQATAFECLIGIWHNNDSLRLKSILDDIENSELFNI